VLKKTKIENSTKKSQNNEIEIPQKSLIFAKSTSIALLIVLLTLGLIFVILALIKFK
jgi:hypothetical protein